MSSARSPKQQRPQHENDPHEQSPAQRYEADRQRRRAAQSEFGKFRQIFDFELDDFQVHSCQALEEGRGVLVAAPTGAGKTVVGEFAVHLALATGRKAFYTTPIKALSNQKYADFVARYGTSQVGLLTGDTTINGNAPIVVMTTEVLRNMLYTGSSTLDDLGFVIMDEVHYLADRFRGPVWEEVIIHLASDVQLVSLSATVSNAEEFGDWLEMVRGDTTVVVTERRPVPLWQHVVARGGRSDHTNIYDLYAGHVDPTDPGTNPPINPQLAEALRPEPQDWSAGRDSTGQSAHSPGGRGSRGRRSGQGQRGRNDHGANNYSARTSNRGSAGSSNGSRGIGRRMVPRFAILDLLDSEELLPAIYFIFSRAGCEGALGQCAASGLRLTTSAQEQRIRRIVDERCAAISETDLAVLGFHRWKESLAKGMAAHHAGMLPLFKETVEYLFSQGLLKVVFATETLALGINMPARTVILEKLVKWDGKSHVALTAGEYTQLTGRAGRRGIDVEGHAVVVDHANLDPIALAGLASRRLYPLKSSFRPTYNMAVNLVDRVGRARAREVLETSFAQFQADRGVVGLAKEAKAHSEALEGYAEAMTCSRGEFPEYAAVRQAITDREKEQSRQRVGERRQQIVDSVSKLRRGDVLLIPGGRRAGYVVVLDPGVIAEFDGPRPTVLTADRRVKKLLVADLSAPVSVATRIRIPKQFNSRVVAARRDLAATMHNALDDLADDVNNADGSTHRPSKRLSTVDDPELTGLRAQLRAHPCHECPDREAHARWSNRWRKAKSEHAALLRRIKGRTGSIARVFDHICEVLETLGYLTREANQDRDDLRVTDSGHMLSRVYTENDLLLAECLRQGAWTKLDPAGLAAAVSTVVYSARRDDHGEEPHLPGGPQGPLAKALDQTVRIWSELDDLEAAHKLETTSPLDFGLIEPMHRWASGRSLDVVLGDSELAAGDFVRWCKQVIDVLDQLEKVSPEPGLRRSAGRAIDALRRGVVAYSSV